MLIRSCQRPERAGSVSHVNSCYAALNCTSHMLQGLEAEPHTDIHPGAETLELFLLRHLERRKEKEVKEHISRCEQCRQEAAEQNEFIAAMCEALKTLQN